MTSPVRIEMPQVAPSEKVAMTSPVRMEMDANGGSEDDEHVYKCAAWMSLGLFRCLIPVSCAACAPPMQTLRM